MKKMEKRESLGHWKRWWAIATLVPFTIALFLSWYFGAPGGYAFASQIKVFLLFLQVGFVTAYFIRHDLKKAAAPSMAHDCFLGQLGCCAVPGPRDDDPSG